MYVDEFNPKPQPPTFSCCIIIFFNTEAVQNAFRRIPLEYSHCDCLDWEFMTLMIQHAAVRMARFPRTLFQTVTKFLSNYTEPLLSLTVSLSFFRCFSFPLLISALFSKSTQGEKAFWRKVRIQVIWLCFKYGRNKEVKTTDAGRWAALPSDIHESSLSF